MNGLQPPTNDVPTGSFRLYLQAELIRRCRVNPRYSLRSFAKQVGVEPSFLSKLIAGKCSVTPKTVDRIGPKLELPPDQLERFKKLTIRKKTGPKPSARVADEDFKQLTLDAFTLVADWYHYAILELFLIEGFEPNPQWISRALGITLHEANSALERLTRLGMLTVDATGKLMLQSAQHTTVSNPYTSVALKTRQRQILEKAIRALDEVPVELRDQTAMTMAIDPADLPLAKERIKAFRRELCKELQDGKKSKAVYEITISLIPLTTAWDRKQQKKESTK